MPIVILLSAGVALSVGFAVMFAAFAVDTVFCHRRSRLLGPARQGGVATPLPGLRPVPLPRGSVSAEAG